MTPTHSSNRQPLTFEDLCKEAFGLEMHPWDLYEYTLNEYILMRMGRNTARKETLRQEFRHFRMLAYYVVSDKLKPSYRGKPIFEVIPDILYEEEKPKDKDWYKKLIANYKVYIKDASGDKNKNRSGRKRTGIGGKVGK